MVLVFLKIQEQGTLASPNPAIKIIFASEVSVEVDNIQEGSEACTLQRNPQNSYFPFRLSFKCVTFKRSLYNNVFQTCLIRTPSHSDGKICPQECIFIASIPSDS